MVATNSATNRVFVVSLSAVNSDFDRAEHLRSDRSALDALKSASSTRILRVFEGRMAWDQEVGESAELFFLGQDSTGVAYFVNHHEHENVQATSTLREIQWSDLEQAVATHAVALTNWHAANPRCPNCGGATEAILSGSVRRCIAEGIEHYPRTDPAVIALVLDCDDRLLLGRQRVWPEKRFSAFAGFVEPGESLEACVHRELFEECGVEVESPAYLGSQAWPFPGSLMVAFQAVTKNPTLARPDGKEIEEIKWFTRDELWQSFSREELLLPPRISIARRMIEHWYGQELNR